MTVHLTISLPKTPYLHRIYIYIIWIWPTLFRRQSREQESGFTSPCVLDVEQGKSTGLIDHRAL